MVLYFLFIKKSLNQKKISYLLIFGFLIPYGYTLLTSVSVIAFDFVAPVFIISFMFFERKLITTLTAIVGVMNILFVRKKNDIIKLMRNLAEVSENNSSATQELSASIEEQTAGIEQTANTSGNLTDLAIELETSISKF